MNDEENRGGCGFDCDCESEEAHEADLLQAEMDFLRSPGAPPLGMSEKAVQQAREAMAKRKKELGIK